jgi:transposase
MYKWRHLIENFFCKLKEFKRIAMRADKTDQSLSPTLRGISAGACSAAIRMGRRIASPENVTQ